MASWAELRVVLGPLFGILPRVALVLASGGAALAGWVVSRRRRASAGSLPMERGGAHLRAVGDLGEVLVAGAVRRLGLPVLRNVVLGPPGRTVEVDHVVRVPDGIVVLEVKTWGGRIDGHPGAESWLQVGRGGEIRSLYNPLRQNRAHVRAVAAFVADSRVPVWGHVVMAGGARLAPPLAVAVVPLDALPALLGGRLVLPGSSSPLDRAWRRLEAAATQSARRMAPHVASVEGTRRQAAARR